MQHDAKGLRKRRAREQFVRGLTFLCALVSVLTTIAIIYVLVSESVSFFSRVSPWEFLTGRRWAPNLDPRSFGILPLLCGTFLIAIGAGILAVPLGLLAAVFLSEYASPRLRAWVKPVIELLAGVPTIVYGFFALTFVTPTLRLIPGLHDLSIFNALSAAIVVGVMILPLVASLSEEALAAVPKSLREGGLAMGATKGEVIRGIVIPGALSGIMSAFILAISRAVGETMAVTLAAGAAPKITLDLRESVQTMSAYIVNTVQGEAPHGSVEYQTLFAVGLTLFVITLVMNLLAVRLVSRFRMKYG